MTNYSHSRLSCFEQCRLKYKYHYIDNIKTEMENTVEAFMGDLIHQALEKLYKDKLVEKVTELKELLEFFDDLWKKHWTDNILINAKGMTQKNYYDTGVRCLTDYYNRYKPFDQGRILGIETKEFIDIAPGYKMHVRIDRLMRNGTIYEVHDYKANKSLPAQAHLDEDRQLALYSLFVEDRFKDVSKIRLIWHFVQFDEEMTSERTPEQLRQLKKEIMELIHTVEKEKKFEPTVGSLCNWCEYQSMCPAWKHKFKVESLPANKYLNDDGVKLVNKYSELYSEKKRLESSLDKELIALKEALIAYAKREGVDVIFGSDKKISVKEYSSVHVPAKGTDERTELEELLHSLKKWGEVSGLDSSALKKAVEDWPSDIRKKVEKYLEVTNEHRVTLGKKGEE